MATIFAVLPGPTDLPQAPKRLNSRDNVPIAKHSIWTRLMIVPIPTFKAAVMTLRSWPEIILQPSPDVQVLGTVVGAKKVQIVD